MRRHPYLKVRNGHYYFRLAVPLSLTGLIGKGELVHSLHTKDAIEAKMRAAILLNVAQQGLRRSQREGRNMVKPMISSALQGFNEDMIVNDRCLLAEIKAAQANVLVPVPIYAGVSFAEAAKAYVRDCKDNRPKSIRRKEAIFDLWRDAMGDTPIQSIGKAQAREFKVLLMKLPANMKQRYRGKTLAQVDLESLPEGERLNVTTVNDLIGYMKAFFNWAICNGHYEGLNPFLGMAIKNKERAIERRLPFSQDQLATIFNSPVYKGCKSEHRLERYTEGKKVIKDGLYWVPLIALYTGARMQEICQLYSDDIKQVDRIWCFDFNDDGDDKNLKNGGSKRKTPIHPKLLELGLIRYRDGIRRRGEKRLFPDLPMASDGSYSNAFSKRFSYLLKRLDIKTNKTSFHSFRHTFIDSLRNARVNREVRQALVGHLDGKSAHDNYGSGMGVRQLYEGICRLRFSFAS